MVGGGVQTPGTYIMDLADTTVWRKGPHDFPSAAYYGESVPFKDSFLVVGGGDGSSGYVRGSARNDDLDAWNRPAQAM